MGEESTHQCELYVLDDPPRLVALGRIFEGAQFLHNLPIPPDMVKVTVEKVREGDAAVPVPTYEVVVVSEALKTFILWPRFLVKKITSSSVSY